MKIDRLIGAIRELDNPSALGLDTRIEFVPKALAREHERAPEAVFAFNSALLHGLREIVPCVKIQAAFYELMGPEGMRCLARTAEEARSLGYVVIIDAKRGDIGSTAEAYSGAFLAPGAPFAADFLTVNPYLGMDGVAPFISDCRETGAGIFVLVKTSNPSSGEFQDIPTEGGSPLYERVGDKVAEWGEQLIGKEGYSSVAAVVGATYPQQGRALRERLPHVFFLLPGYGAQGARAEDLAGCFDRSGSGAVVAASRSIICAHMKNPGCDFVEASRCEALRMRDSLREALRGGTAL